MTTVLVHHRVADFDAWKQIYDHARKLQENEGVRSHRVWRSQDDSNLVVVEHTFDSREAAETFANSSEVRDAMGRAGVEESSVHIEYLNEVSFGML